jgi:two-component system chemotaxis response regulator CheY
VYKNAIVKTLMIVDNSVSTRSAVGVTLCAEGYTVIEAINGQDVIGKLSGQKVN